jgi:hypothetical protein
MQRKQTLLNFVQPAQLLWFLVFQVLARKVAENIDVAGMIVAGGGRVSYRDAEYRGTLNKLCLKETSTEVFRIQDGYHSLYPELQLLPSQIRQTYAEAQLEPYICQLQPAGVM